MALKHNCCDRVPHSSDFKLQESLLISRLIPDAPIDVIQAVLNRRLPAVSTKRMDVPDVLSNIIQKMTQKQIDERYCSTSGLKYDFAELQRVLGEGDGEALLEFKIGSKDVSSIFTLPNDVVGRGEEHEKIVSVLEKVTKLQPGNRNGSSTMLISGSLSTLSDNAEDGVRSSSVSSLDQASNTIPNTGLATNSTHRVSRSDSMEDDGGTPGLIQKPLLAATDSRDTVETTFSMNSYSSTTGPSASQRNGHAAASRLPARPRASHEYRPRHRSEVILISGSAGLGKSTLLQHVQVDIRDRDGYIATAKFEQDRSRPFEPIFSSISSLFRQIFSER